MEMPILTPVPFNRGAGYLETLARYTRNWEFVDDYHIQVLGYDIIIPERFVLDGASIPKILRGLLSPTGILFIPALVHDYAYKYHELILRDTKGERQISPITKEEADLLFLQIANTVNGLNIVNRTAYVAVKYFGHKAWNEGGTKA